MRNDPLYALRPYVPFAVKPSVGRLLLALRGLGGLRGAAGVRADLVPHPVGLHAARPVAGRPHLGGQVVRRRAPVRPAGRGGRRGRAHPARAGLAEVPAGRRAGVQLPLRRGPVGQHRAGRDEVLREALHCRAGRHAGDSRRVVPHPRGGHPPGQPGGAAGDSPTAGQRGAGRGDGDLSLEQAPGLDNQGVRPAGGAPPGADGADGQHGVPPLPQLGELGAETPPAYRPGRAHVVGRQPDNALHLPRGLLLRGRRQGPELAGVPLLGAAARAVHRGPCLARVVVGRRGRTGEVGPGRGGPCGCPG